MADNRAELRRLLQQHKQQSAAGAAAQPQVRVTDKLAKYDANGRLGCIVCKTSVADNGWQQHVNTSQHINRVRELKELAARRKAEAELVKAATQAPSSSAHVTHSALPIERAQVDTLTVPEPAPRPTSPAPHPVPVHVSTASALPADFFDADETDNSSDSVEDPTAEATSQSSTIDVVESVTVQHPTAARPQIGEGEHLSARIEEEQQRAEEAKAETERERHDTEAAIALAIALSKQQSQHIPSVAPARPTSPLPTTALSTAGAASLPDALEAFEAELAVAEEEGRVASKEEERRLARMRRDVDVVEEEERKLRLDDIKQRVAEAKRKRDEQQQLRQTAADGESSSKRTKSGKQRVDVPEVEAEEDGDGDLMAELDGMFDWRRQQR